MKNCKIFVFTVLLMCALAFIAQSAVAAKAGHFGRIVADVTVDGTPAQLSQDFDSGATIQTGKKGLALLNFTDGTRMLLRSETTLSVKDYFYESGKPAEGKFVTEMAKGGLRALSGFVSKQNPSAVRYESPMMVLGIRGTQFKKSIVDNKLYAQVDEGALKFTNISGKQEVIPAGETIVFDATGKVLARGAEALKMAEEANAFSELNDSFVTETSADNACPATSPFPEPSPMPVTWQCKPDCDWIGEEVNRLTAEVIELNNRITAATEELGSYCHQLQGLENAPKTTQPSSQCTDGKKIELGMIYQGDQGGTVKAHERIAAGIGTGGANLFSGYDTESYSSFDDMLKIIRSKLRKPYDPKGKCRDCIEKLVLYQHGSEGERDSLAGVFQFGSFMIGDYYVDKAGKFKTIGVIKKDTDKIAQLKQYLCEDAELVFLQCNIGEGAKGDKTGQALSNFLGVKVLAPTIAASFGSCPSSDDYTSGDWKLFEPQPTDQVAATPQSRAEERLAREKQNLQDRIAARKRFIAQLRAERDQKLAGRTEWVNKLLACEQKCAHERGLSKDARALGDLFALPLDPPAVQTGSSSGTKTSLAPGHELPRGNTPVVPGRLRMIQVYRQLFSLYMISAMLQGELFGIPPAVYINQLFNPALVSRMPDPFAYYTALIITLAYLDPNDPFYGNGSGTEESESGGIAKYLIGDIGFGESEGIGDTFGGVPVATVEEDEADDQWGLHRIGYTNIGSNSAWDIEPGNSKNVVVAVIDSGLDMTHPDAPQYLWRNEGEIPGNQRDDDGNGYVDDINGWNFFNENNNLDDDYGHGTFVAGIIAAKRNNAEGIAGINPGAQIMVLKVGSGKEVPNGLGLYRAIRYAVDNGARIINISLGGQAQSKLVQAGINYASAMGVLVVVAAGNDGANIANYSPPGSMRAFSVAGMNMGDRRRSSSNFGGNVSVMAPGHSIYSLTARNGLKDDVVTPRKSTKYHRLSGTSFAAPMVAGTASLMLAKNPNLTREQLEDILTATAEDMFEPGWDSGSGAGLINARRALEMKETRPVVVRPFELYLDSHSGNVNWLDVYGIVRGNVKRYSVALGKGPDPDNWDTVCEGTQPPAEFERLCRIEGKHFKWSEQWTIRISAESRKGDRKEARVYIELR